MTLPYMGQREEMPDITVKINFAPLRKWFAARRLKLFGSRKPQNPRQQIKWQYFHLKPFG